MNVIKIAVANAKGGVGKSTIAMLLAAALGKHQAAVVADSDPQGTALLWSKLGKFPVPVARLVVGQTAAEVATAAGASLVIVDCPPNLDAATLRATLAEVDLLLIPCPPACADVWATLQMFALLDAEFPDLPRLVVLTQIPSRTALGRDNSDIIEANWPTARTRLALRTAYKETMAVGGTLDDLRGSGARAARDEMSALALEVMSTVAAL